MLNQQNRLLARLTLSALMGVAACLPTLTHAEALNFEEAAHRLQANSDRLAMTRFSVESAQLKEQATRHLGGPVVTAGAAAFRFQGAVQGIDLTPPDAHDRFVDCSVAGAAGGRRSDQESF